MNPFVRVYKTLAEVTDPLGGHLDHWRNCWWSYVEGEGIIFVRRNKSRYLIAQCNSNKAIAQKLQEQLYPDATLLFVPHVYIPHNCNDYVDCR